MKKYKTVALFFAGFVLFDGISVLNFFIRDTNEYWIMYLVFVMGLWCLFYAIYLLRQPCIKSREFDPSYVKNPLEYIKKSYQNTDLLLAILIFTTFIVGGFLYITTIISEIMRGLGGIEYIYLIIAVLIAVVFIVLFVKLLIASFSDEPVKHIIKFISSCPEGREAAIEKFYDLYFNGDKTDNFVLNDDYIMVKLLTRTLFMNSEDLLWVRDVPAAGGGTNYSLRLYFKNGSFEAISSLSKSDIDKYMDILGAKYPYLCYGNTDFLLNEFNNNRDNMINTVEQRRHSI